MWHTLNKLETLERPTLSVLCPVPGVGLQSLPGLDIGGKGGDPVQCVLILSAGDTFLSRKTSRLNLRKSNRLPALILTVHFKTHEFWRGTTGAL